MEHSGSFRKKESFRGSFRSPCFRSYRWPGAFSFPAFGKGGTLELKKLRRELSSEGFTKLYQELKKGYPLLSQFPDPFSLIDFFHDKESDYLIKDAILSYLIRHYQRGGRFHLLGAFFLTLFTPGIVSIYSREKRKALSLEPEEILNQISLFILQTIEEKQITQKEKKVASQIIGQVKNQIRSWINKKLKEEKALELSRKKNCEPHPSGEKCLPDLKEAERFLNLFVKARVITEADKFIILGSKVARKPLRKIITSSESYERIKKRRQRAVRAMEKYLLKQRKRYALRAGLKEEEVFLAEVLKDLRE